MKWLVLALLAYWAVYAAVVPVINYDSQVYNLARLLIANVGGLFGNQGWNTPRQVILPWTFDAVHYPFLFLHWGYCLPSFACFVGLLIVVYRLVAAATRSTRCGWWCCLALLALPTLVYQAVDTKNDIPVVFGAACWLYAWRLWQEERRRVYLPLMALALGFVAGAKTTGVPICALLGAYSLYGLRTDRRSLGWFFLWTATFVVLFGSVEIYVNNQILFHSPLGPPAYIDQNKNRDGLAGAAASFIRYCFSNMSVGIDAGNPTTPVIGWLEDHCRAFLHLVGLNNVGYRSDYGEVDANMHFCKNGGDAGSDFGAIGALALVAGFLFVLARPPSDPLWKLSAAGFVTLALVSGAVAWMPWNARFLMLPFSLFTVALTVSIFRLGDNNSGRGVRSVFLLFAVFSAVACIACSTSQNPKTIWLSLRHRPAVEMNARPGMIEIVRDLRLRANAKAPPVVLVQVADDAWSLCVLEVAGLRFVPWSFVTAESLAASRPLAGRAPIYVLTVNKPLLPAVKPDLTLVRRYAEWEGALYQWQPPGGPGAPQS